MGDTREKRYKELDIIWTQLHMTVKEAPDRESGAATVEYAIAKFQ
jgi:hypothetical protein